MRDLINDCSKEEDKKTAAVRETSSSFEKLTCARTVMAVLQA